MNSPIAVVVRKEWLEIGKQRHLKYGLAVLTVLWMLNIGFVSRTIIGMFGRDAVSMLVDSIVSHQMLTVYAISAFSLVQIVFTKERLSGSLESLLTTPVTVHEIWIGKTIAVFLGGFLASILVAVGVIVEMNIMYAGEFGIILPRGPSLVFFVTVGPLLSFAICATLGLLHFNTKLYAVGAVLYMFLGTGYLFFASKNMNKLIMSPRLLLGYAGAALLILAVAWTMARGLDKEKVLACQR